MARLANTLLAAALALPVAVTAQPLKTADIDSQAVLLVAHPQLRDPMWLETVLIAAPLPTGGHLGLILNRPTRAMLGALFPEHAASQKIADPVYFGGPFLAENLVALVRSEQSPGEGCFPLGEGLFLAVNAQTIDRIIEQQPQAARYYVGLVLWRPGELALELTKGLWSLHGVDARTVLRRNTEGLWRDLGSAARNLYVRTLSATPQTSIAFTPSSPSSSL